MAPPNSVRIKNPSPFSRREMLTITKHPEYAYLLERIEEILDDCEQRAIEIEDNSKSTLGIDLSDLDNFNEELDTVEQITEQLSILDQTLGLFELVMEGKAKVWFPPPADSLKSLDEIPRPDMHDFDPIKIGYGYINEHEDTKNDSEPLIYSSDFYNELPERINPQYLIQGREGSLMELCKVQFQEVLQNIASLNEKTATMPNMSNIGLSDIENFFNQPKIKSACELQSGFSIN